MPDTVKLAVGHVDGLSVLLTDAEEQGDAVPLIVDEGASDCVPEVLRATLAVRPAEGDCVPLGECVAQGEGAMVGEGALEGDTVPDMD